MCRSGRVKKPASETPGCPKAEEARVGDAGYPKAEYPGAFGVTGMTTTKDIPVRERILRAADELFYQRGFAVVGVDAVIERAGVAKMSLYHHFGSKDELVAEVMRVRDERWFAKLKADVDRAARPGVSRLMALFEVLAAWHAEPDFAGCAFLNIATELRDPAHPARQVALGHHHRLRSYLSELARDEGVTKADELGEALSMLVAGCTIWATLEREPADGRERGRAAAARAGEVARHLVACARGMS